MLKPFETRPWNVVDHLEKEEDIAAYLDAASEYGGAAFMVVALGDIARAKPMTRFCQRWRIRGLALFGSALRDDFHADSDLDLLVTFEDDASWSLLDHVQMEQELSALLGREVDLVSRRAVEQSANWLLRREILGSASYLYNPSKG